MVELVGMRSDSASFDVANDLPVKVMIAEEDSSDDEHGPLNKRSRLAMSTPLSPPLDQLSTGNNEFPVQPSQFSPLDEPSPLGLRLRKSPSLLDLIQMRLSNRKASSLAAAPSGNKKDAKGKSISVACDKLKASNFAASLLRIGSWEFVSRYEGDLVAKCYFAKHKLVWEVLQNGLKSKIEIQWSNIMALKATCPENGPETLTIMLTRQPLFFRETNPQPRKHTLWKAATDFTDGQASINRQHFLQCPPGVLNKHFEKLIQCDTRLYSLSQQPESVMESPYFQTQALDVENPDEPRASGSSQIVTGGASPISYLSDGASPGATELSSLTFEQWETASAHLPKDSPSSSSGNGSSEQPDLHAMNNWEQSNMPGLRPSMSMTDLVNHIGHCISEHMNSGNIPLDRASECQDMLENISQILLSDSHSVAASDEKLLMKRVNSLYCLLQDPATASSLQADGANFVEGLSAGKDDQTGNPCDDMRETLAPKDGLGCKPTKSIPRKDSLGDLLLQLPRISSLSKFLFDISGDGDSQGG